jgi:hypothetical protein
MKSKYFSNEFRNKIPDFSFNAAYCPKPLPALVSKLPVMHEYLITG